MAEGRSMADAPIENAAVASLHGQDPVPPRGWLGVRLPVASLVRREYGIYPVPANLNWLWNVGACVTVTLALLVFSGFFLSVDYAAEPDRAFASVEAIERRVPWGWLLRSLHMASASALFAGLAIHTWRSLYYGSYKQPREIVWLTGTGLMLVVMATAFLGYTLPFGQMSYWALVVASHALRSLPVVGEGAAALLLGGDAIGAPALHRAFAFHFALGGLAIVLVALHVASLHAVGSNNPAGVDPPPGGQVPFFPDHAARVVWAAGVWLLLVACLAFFAPGALTDPANDLPADAARTPPEIAPPWYFLPFYAILRAFPGAAGVVLSAGTVLLLPALPWLDRDPRRAVRARPIFRASVLLLIPVVALLGIAGHEETRHAWLAVARVATLWWYAHVLLLLPLAPDRPR